jgi:inositol 2-dehydrogenase
MVIIGVSREFADIMADKTQRLGVGVVGVGSIGRVHAENLASQIPKAELVGIADSNLEAAKTVAAKLGVEKTYSDFAQLLQNKEVEAIVLAVPPFLKRDMMIAAARAGKHVFVEKPMALALKEVDEAMKEAERSRIKVQVGYQRRFDHSHVRAEEAIRAGEIGKILLVNSHTRDPPWNPSGWSADPKFSGGIFLDTCSHDFDAIRFLTKSEITRVYADGAALTYDELKAHGDKDHVVVTLNLSNGALGYVDSCGYTVYGYDIRAEVLGTEGAVFVNMGERSSAQILKKSSQHNGIPATYVERFAQAYRDEVADFVECVLEDKQPKVTAMDGRAALEIGAAATISIKEHRPVSLPL